MDFEKMILPRRAPTDRQDRRGRNPGSRLPRSLRTLTGWTSLGPDPP